MIKLQFYDLKAKEKFETEDYTLESKETIRGKVYFAKTISPSGTKCSRIVTKEFYIANKE